MEEFWFVITENYDYDNRKFQISRRSIFCCTDPNKKISNQTFLNLWEPLDLDVDEKTKPEVLEKNEMKAQRSHYYWNFFRTFGVFGLSGSCWKDQNENLWIKRSTSNWKSSFEAVMEEIIPVNTDEYELEKRVKWIWKALFGKFELSEFWCRDQKDCFLNQICLYTAEVSDWNLGRWTDTCSDGKTLFRM